MMRSSLGRFRRAVLLSCFAAATAALGGAEVFPIPLRINMGGPTRVDSLGHTWLGDGAGPGDLLGIRVDDLSGVNTIESWGGAGGTGNFQPASLAALGFDPGHPDDVAIFDSVRWDVGGDGIDFLLEIPVPVGTYQVNLYFTEECCTNRHFKISLQDEIVDDDVSYLDYDRASPGLGRVGVLSFPGIEVGDEILRIGFLPCPECPGGGDINPIIDAIEVVSGPGCDHRGLDFRCSLDPATGVVSGTWIRPEGADGFEILREGRLLGARLPAEAASFADPSPPATAGFVLYTVRALRGNTPIGECSATLLAHACAAGLAGAVPSGGDEVLLTWSPCTPNLGATGYELRRDGQSVATIPPGTTSWRETLARRFTHYELTPLGPAGAVCPPLACRVVADAFPFELPLRIDMGGPGAVDSHGDAWLGDGPGAGDPLGIRPDDRGGAETVVDWGTLPGTPNFLPDGLASIGFDPASAADASIFDSIRYDAVADSSEFALAIPLPAGSYEASLYFIEECCPARHFRLEIQGTIVDDDLTWDDFAVDPGSGSPSLGWPGRLTFDDIAVPDGILRMRLLPCDPCPPGSTREPLVSAIEIARSGALPVVVERLLSRRTYASGDEVEVSLDIRCAAATDLEISEVLPAAASARSPSDGGAIAVNAIAWTLKNVTAKTLSYTLAPGACSIAAEFPGSTWRSGARSGPTGGASRIVHGFPQEADLGPWSLADLTGEGGGIEVLGPRSLALEGGGLGTRLAEDRVRFAWFPVKGDFDLVARVDCFDDPGGLGGAGIMVRSGLEPHAAMAFFYLVSGTAPGTASLKGMWRTVTSRTRNAKVLSLDSRDVPALPHFLRMTRRGGKLELARSSDGGAFAAVFSGDIGTTGIDLPEDALLGLAVAGGGSRSGASFSALTGPALPAGNPVALFRRADADGTGTIDLADVITTLNYLFLAGEVPSCLDAADGDDSGILDLADPIHTLYYLFLAGEPPPAPGPTECGADPTASALPPCVYRAEC